MTTLSVSAAATTYPTNFLPQILAAHTAIAPWLQLPTPVFYSPWLSTLSGAEVYLKMENAHEVRAFKIRGAFNFMCQMSEAERKNGVVTASGGNHGLSVAFAAYRTGAPCTVLMTNRAPQNVIELCEGYKAKVIIHGDVYEDTEAHAISLAEKAGQPFIPAFDHPAIIAGQGTVALELQKQVPDADAVIMSVGGGGLVAGVACGYGEIGSPIQMISAEPEYAGALYESLKAGHRVEIANPVTRWAEKLMPRSIGVLNYELSKHYIKQAVTVPDAEIEWAVMAFLEHNNLLVEGSAAITAAVLMRLHEQLAGKKVVLVLSGGNINLPLLKEALANQPAH
jgi:threonine dehydratase